MSCRAEHWEPRKGLLGEVVYFSVNANSSWDPSAALVLNNWKFEFGERANPKLPDFGKVFLGADHYCIIDICKDVDFERGEIWDSAEFGAEVIYGVF